MEQQGIEVDLNIYGQRQLKKIS